MSYFLFHLRVWVSSQGTQQSRRISILLRTDRQVVINGLHTEI